MKGWYTLLYFLVTFLLLFKVLATEAFKYHAYVKWFEIQSGL